MRFNVDDYVDVQTRINKFWSENPTGAIVTEVIYGVDFDRVIVRAQVFKTKEPGAKTDTLPDSTGIAAEIRGETPRDGANFTSWHENAETSAIGRALANMGYATSGKDRMSREEADKVNRTEDAPLPARSRTTSVNTVPNEQPTATGWTQFWTQARRAGLNTKPDAVKAIGDLGADPDYALERLAAWEHDNATQPELAS